MVTLNQTTNGYREITDKSDIVEAKCVMVFDGFNVNNECCLVESFGGFICLFPPNVNTDSCAREVMSVIDKCYYSSDLLLNVKIKDELFSKTSITFRPSTSDRCLTVALITKQKGRRLFSFQKIEVPAHVDRAVVKNLLNDDSEISALLLLLDDDGFECLEFVRIHEKI